MNAKKVMHIIIMIFFCILFIPIIAATAELQQVSGDDPTSADGSSFANFAKGPYMIYENINTEMVVLWQADSVATDSQIEWGSTPSYGNGPYTVPLYGDMQYRYTIQGLTPGTLYYYRVNLDGIYQTGSFRAAPSDTATSVSIYAYGDSQAQPDQNNIVLGSLLVDMNLLPERRHSIILQSGDKNSNGDDELDWTNQCFNRSYPNILTTQSMLPIMGSRGNHEGTAILQRKYWPYLYQDASACYHSFDYGPLHVLAVDDMSELAPGSTQYNWIMNGIMTSTKPWKLVIYHQPAWGAGWHINNIASQILAADVYEPYGVALTLAGHNHHYARCYKQPIQHVTMGGGGAPLYGFDPTFPYFVTASMNYHFIRIDIDGNQFCVTATGTTGEVYDNFCVYNTFPGKIKNSLQISKLGNNPVLTWNAPGGLCLTDGYQIYRGTLPFESYNHYALSCFINSTTYTDSFAPDSYYYLVVPDNATREGSYGTNSYGDERPQALIPCKLQDTSPCN